MIEQGFVLLWISRDFSPKFRNAAVALVLRKSPVSPGGVEILLIKRAKNPKDRWSGQVALPGGRCDEGEVDIDTAVRETREEVGLDLSAGGFKCLGRLTPKHMSFGIKRPFHMIPIVFVQCSDGVVGDKLVPDEKEVEAAWWIDLDELVSSDRAPQRRDVSAAMGKLGRNWFVKVLR